MVHERMIRTLSLWKRPGPDQLTSVGQLHEPVIAEPQSGWLTKLQIAKTENGKGNTLSHI